MKKIMAVVLSLVMVLSMVATVSAASVADLTVGLPNPLNLTLTPVVGARLGTSSAAFSSDLDISADGATAKTVDYQATLDMSLIRAIFDGDMITDVFADATAKAEFDAATISSTITIAITYPAGVTIPADWTTSATELKGFTQIGSIFAETPGSRTDTANTVTVTVTSADKTADEFAANVDEYFKDIVFDLPDVVSYTALGTYNVGISVTGSTTANFTSGAKTINYSGSATSVVDLVQASTPSRPSAGGGSVTPTYTVTFNTNGGSEVESVKVKSGDKITAPETVKEGYAFDGWYADAGFKTAYDFDAAIKKNTTVYAKWIEKTDRNTIILTINEKDATVFGETVTNDVAPQIVSDRTLLPIRFVAESLGATVGWEEATETVTIKLGDIDIVLVIGEMFAAVNGENVALDVKSFVENDRTYLPLRFVAENLGAIVEWDEATQKVTIIKR